MRDDDDGVALAEGDRVVLQLERLLEVRERAPASELAQPLRGDLRGVERSADAGERDALLFGDGFGGAMDRVALGENFFDEGGLRLDCVVGVVRMRGAPVGHLLFRGPRCIR